MNDPSENKAIINKKRTLVLLIAAGVLLIGAVVWRVVLEANGLTSRIVRELAAHGCSVDGAELTQHAYGKDSSIREMMGDKDISAAEAASRTAGFPSDIDKKGEVYCLLAQLDSGVLTVFVVDEKVELAFIQLPDSDEVLTVTGAKP